MFIAYASQFIDAIDRAPIKLNTAADSVDSRPQHHGVAAREGDVILAAVVRQIEVVSDRWPLGRNCVDLLDARPNVQLFAHFAHDQIRAVSSGIERYSAGEERTTHVMYKQHASDQ